MIAQHVWPAAAWRALFVEHPILRFYGPSLIWTTASGSFHVHERALQGPDGAPLDPPGDGGVRLLHPALADTPTLEAWRARLEARSIQQPFDQLLRPRGQPREGEATARRCQRFEGRPLMPYDAVAAAKRLGWKMNIIYGEQFVSCFRTFPSAAGGALDAFLKIDQHNNHALSLYFTAFRVGRAGSGHFYDPRGDDDLIPLGEVPPAIFAEAIGALEELMGAP